MLQQPKRLRYRRPSDGRVRQYSKRGNQLAFGSFGIKALDSKWITAHQIEAARVAVTRYMQREGNIWIRIFPHKPITLKVVFPLGDEVYPYTVTVCPRYLSPL